MLNAFSSLMDSFRGPQYSAAPQFVLSNDTINQSLDMLVIFNVYFDSKMDEVEMHWLRKTLNEFLRQKHDGSHVSNEELTSVLDRQWDDGNNALSDELKHAALIGCIVYFMTGGEKYAIRMKPSFMKFISTDFQDLTLDEYNDALLVLYTTMYNHHLEVQYSAAPLFSDKDWSPGYTQSYLYTKHDFLPCLDVFELLFKDLEKRVLTYRDYGRFIDIDYDRKDSRRMVKSDTEFEACKQYGELRREYCRKELASQIVQLNLQPAQNCSTHAINNVKFF